MSRFRALLFVTLFACCASEVSHAQMMDPVYGFPYGYALGAQASFRNRLPTPPYFSVYPPVYYGKRYVRPYGESPYASFPLLGQIPDYSPVPAQTRAAIPRIIENPHAPCCSDQETDPHDPAQPKVMIVTENRAGSRRIIINPYAREQIATTEK